MYVRSSIKRIAKQVNEINSFKIDDEIERERFSDEDEKSFFHCP